MQAEQNGFTQECMMNYLELIYKENNTHPYSNRQDVTITIPGRTTGSIDCIQATFYSETIAFFSSKGYMTNSPTATFLGTLSLYFIFMNMPPYVVVFLIFIKRHATTGE
jgi:hypothetical protein